jgi:aldehyde:ferredoxin oxidoreductase
MMVDKTRNFVDSVVDGDNIEAGETFKVLMQDKQLDAIDLKRVEMQLDWMNNNKTEV